MLRRDVIAAFYARALARANDKGGTYQTAINRLSPATRLKRRIARRSTRNLGKLTELRT